MNIATQTQSVLPGFMAGKQVQKWIVVVLVLIVASHVANLTWRMMSVPESVQSVPQQMTPSPTSHANKQRKEKGLDTLANLHLFGVAGAGNPVGQIEKKAPETSLNLTLHGVFVGEDPEQGAAIIGTSGSTQKYYKVGAPVMNGVTLGGVFTDRVVLMRDGQAEVLRFPTVSSPSSSSRIASLPVASTRSVPKVSSSGSSSRIASLPVASTRSVPTENNASLRGYREVFQQEPLKIFEHVRFVPGRSRDGLKGYRVLPQENRAFYNKLGIRPSDLVTAVNGVNLTNYREAMKLMGMLKDASTIQVDIVRNGQSQSLTFSLN